jgi:hypothetical protein
MVDQAIGELVERRLGHKSGEAQALHGNLQRPDTLILSAISLVERNGVSC